MTRGERIALAMRRKNLLQGDVATALGVSQNIVSRIITGKIPGNKHIAKLASLLSVPTEWLTVGENPPDWVAPTVLLPAGSGSIAVPLEGQVSAGPGDIDMWGDITGNVTIGSSWAAVRVKGDSAYPAVYSDQLAIVDNSRAVDMRDFNERAGWDLDDDMVLVRLHNGGAMLKRFCFHPPDKFILASANGGRRSPMVDPKDIQGIVPVVGVIYHGANERGPDRWMEKRAARGHKGGQHGL